MLAKQMKSTQEEEEEKMAKLWCIAEGWVRKRRRKEGAEDVQVGVGRL